MFKDGPGALEWVREKILSGRKGTLAVAFWGTGAAEQLGIDRRPSGQPLTIICNLTMGGTNPNEVRRLLELKNENVTVRQSDKLHGKVYSFPDAALIGSANASANGLSFEGPELSGWHEACLVTEHEDAVADVKRWVKTLEARKISEDDLGKADAAWKRRRERRYADDVGAMLAQIRTGPELLAGRRIYLVAYTVDELSEQGQETTREAVSRFGPTIEWYEDWPTLPRNATLLSFLVTGSGKIKRIDDVMYRWPEDRSLPTGKGNERLELCLKQPGKEILSAEQAQWQKVLTWFVTSSIAVSKREGWNSEEGSGFLDLEQIAKAVKNGELSL